MDQEYIQKACAALKAQLPTGQGFILLTFEFDTPGRLYYASNGKREDCVSAMQEFLIRAGTSQNWMKHQN